MLQPAKLSNNQTASSIHSAEERILAQLNDRIGVIVGDVEQLSLRVQQLKVHLETIPALQAKLDDLQAKLQLKEEAGTALKTEAKLFAKLIGFDSHVPFYVNEQLTKAHYEIFKAAIKLKKKKLLAAVFIRRSLVHVKEAGSDDIFCISDISELSQMHNDNALPQQNVTATEDSEQSFRN
ncbi:hypothetical protein ACLKA6_008035 [Drosophila palustris]